MSRPGSIDPNVESRRDAPTASGSRPSATLPSRICTIRSAADQHDGLPLTVKPAEQLHDLRPSGRVEGAGWFVGEEQRGLVGQGPGDGEALPLSSRQHPRRLPGLVGQPQQVEEVPGPRLGLLPGGSGDHRRQRHVLEDAHPLQQVEELEDDPDVLAAHAGQVVLVLPRQPFPGQHDLALRGRVQPGHHVQEGGLPAARRPHHGHELPLLHVQVHSAKGSDRRALRLLALVGLAESAHLEHTHVSLLLEISSSSPSGILQVWASRPRGLARQGAAAGRTSLVVLAPRPLAEPAPARWCPPGGILPAGNLGSPQGTEGSRLARRNRGCPPP